MPMVSASERARIGLQHAVKLHSEEAVKMRARLGIIRPGRESEALDVAAAAPLEQEEQQFFRALRFLAVALAFDLVGLLIPHDFPPVLALGGAIAALVALVVQSRKVLKVALWVGFTCYAVTAFILWPLNSNHSLLALSMTAAALLVRFDDPDSRRSWLVAVPTLLGAVVLLAGVQKFLYGTYFDGRVLVWNPQFDWMVRLMVPESSHDLIQVARHADAPVGVGLRAPLLTFAANVVWVGEVIAGPMLWFQRTRRAGLYLFLALMIPTQLAAVELEFFVLLCVASMASDRPEAWRVWMSALAILIPICFLLEALL